MHQTQHVCSCFQVINDVPFSAMLALCLQPLFAPPQALVSEQMCFSLVKETQANQLSPEEIIYLYVSYSIIIHLWHIFPDLLQFYNVFFLLLFFYILLHSKQNKHQHAAHKLPVNFRVAFLRYHTKHHAALLELRGSTKTFYKLTSEWRKLIYICLQHRPHGGVGLCTLTLCVTLQVILILERWLIISSLFTWEQTSWVLGQNQRSWLACRCD